MPAILAGPVKITTVSSGGTVLFGDTAFIAPKNASKSYSGAGSGFTGDMSASYTGISSTNTIDNDIVDNNTNSAT